MAGPTFAITGPSGIDLNSLVDALVNIEQNKVIRVENEKTAFQVKIDAYNKVRGMLVDIQTKAKNLSEQTSFDVFTASSSDDSVATITGGAGSVDGTYGLQVFQRASNEKLISADKKINSLTTPLSGQGVTVGEISIAGKAITIGAGDTLNDLRAKINSATDEKGNKLGVNASVMKVADGNYRLILLSKETGSTGIEYRDVSGSTLQDLGLISNAAGDKGNLAQVLTSATSIVDAWNNLGTGETITYSGTDHDGRAVTNTFVKTAASTIDQFYSQISETFHNMVTVTTDGADSLTITDKVQGRSRLSLGTMTFGSDAQAVRVTQSGVEGKGVLSVGKDAYFNLEGMAMQSATNTVSGFLPGATIELKGVSAEKQVSVGLTRDLDGITAKFKELLTSYNNLSIYSKNAVKIADPKEKNASDGELAGDMTLSSIVERVRDAFRKKFDLLGGDLTTLTMIGMSSDPKDGTLSVDEKKFKKALETDLSAIQKIFTTSSVSSNPSLAFGRNTADTQSGKYEVEEQDSMHLRIRLAGTSEWTTSTVRVGEVVTFASGPAKGLSLSAAQGAIPSTATFTLSKGLGTVISETVGNMTNSRTGVLAVKQTSLQKSIERSDTRIADLTTRVENYRNRLIRQFTDMETSMQNLQQQSARLTATFGSGAQ